MTNEDESVISEYRKELSELHDKYAKLLAKRNIGDKTSRGVIEEIRFNSMLETVEYITKEGVFLEYNLHPFLNQ